MISQGEYCVPINPQLPAGFDDTPNEARPPSHFEIHPACLASPEMEPEAYARLRDDIRANGLVVPILRDKLGRVIDGRHRLRACVELQMRPSFASLAPLDASDPATIVSRARSLNEFRRHLSPSQRAMYAADLAGLKAGRPQTGKFAGLPEPGRPAPLTQAQAAAAIGISERTVRSACAVRDCGDAVLIASVERGEVSVSAAAARILPRDARAIVRAGKHIAAHPERVTVRPRKGLVLSLSAGFDPEAAVDEMEAAALDADLMEAFGRELIARAKRMRLQAKAKAERAGLHRRRR